MSIFITMLFAFGSIYGGYCCGYAIDTQYRDPDGGLPRITIPYKQKWLFYFRWLSGCEVLRVGVFLELFGLFIGSMQIILCLIGICCNIKTNTVLIISFILLFIYAFISTALLVYNSIHFRRNYDKKNIRGKRCWSCEIEAHIHACPPARKVTVQFHIDKGRRYYCITLEGNEKKQFWAIANGFDPQDGSTVFALYGNDAPYFELVPRSPDVF